MHILHVEKLDQLQQAETVVLPYHVHRRTHTAIRWSNRQRVERWLTFAIGKQTKVVARGKSTPFRVSKQEVGFVSNTKPPKSGNSLIFHTHPKLTKTYLYSLGFTDESFYRDTGYPLSAYVTAFNSALNVFTCGDVASFIADGKKKKYRSISDLLGTSRGYSWMLWSPELSRFQAPARSVAAYEKKENQLFSRCIKQLLSATDREVVLARYRKAFNRLLHSFCREQGILLFQNDNPADRLLHRVC